MPAVGDLDRLWQRQRRDLAIAAATDTGEDGDLRMSEEPFLDGAAFAIRQEGDDVPPLQVAYQRAVALPLAERPVVNADYVQGGLRASARGDARSAAASRLAGTIPRRAKPSAGLPPRASPR